mmetsp:Transcript_2374/g.5632  ORF Transcript_2374/g.5632 Transcript_2374/m.5632 type:complete len:672 (-) Transcript_2374:474-2489(-)
MEVVVVVLIEDDGLHTEVLAERRASDVEVGEQLPNFLHVVRTHGRGSRLLSLFLLASLDLDSLLGLPRGHSDGGSHSTNLGKVTVPFGHVDVEVEGTQVSSGNDELDMRGVGAVEGHVAREALGRGPERSAAGCNSILGEGEGELSDTVHVVVLKLVSGPCDALLKGPASLLNEAPSNLGEALPSLSGVLRGEGLGVVWLLQPAIDVARRLLEVPLELRAGPGEAVVDVVREGVQRTHGRLLLGGVPGRAVVFGEEGEHDLGVALGPECAGLKQRPLEVHAARVNVKASVDVVQSVGHNIKRLPESVIEHGFRLWAHAVVHGGHAQRGVDSDSSVGGNGGLVLANVGVTEEELARQVGLLDGVVVGHCELAAAARGHSHACKVLQELAPQSSSTNKENLEVAESLLHVVAEYNLLRVISGTRRGDICRCETLRESLHTVEVEPLHQRMELARHGLQNLLGNNASKDSSHRAEVTTAGVRKRSNQVLIKCFDLGAAQGFVDLFGQLDELRRIRSVPRLRELPVVLPVSIKSGKSNMHLGRGLKLGEVAEQKLPRIRCGLPQRLEVQSLGFFHRSDNTPTLVGGESPVTELNEERLLLAVHSLDSVRTLIQLSHAFHLGERHQHSIVELNALVFDTGYQCGIALANGSNDRGDRLFAIRVRANELGSEVAKNI